MKLNIERLKRVYSALRMHCLYARCTGLKVTIITSLIMFIEDTNIVRTTTPGSSAASWHVCGTFDQTELTVNLQSTT